MRKERVGVAGEEIFARGRNRDTWAALDPCPYFIFTILLLLKIIIIVFICSAVLDQLHPNHFHLQEISVNLLKTLTFLLKYQDIFAYIWIKLIIAISILIFMIFLLNNT